MLKHCFLFVLALISSQAQADEVACLARIMYAESKGEPLEGVAVLAESAISLAEQNKWSICQLAKSGQAHSEPVPELVKPYFVAMSAAAVRSTRRLSRGADHWDTGKPHLPGSIVRKVGKHTFYILKKAG